MTLVSSGQISAGVSSPANQSINTELGKAYNAQLSLNDTDARALAGITGSGTQISYSSFYGKSSRNSYYITFTTSHSDATISVADTTSGSFVAGSTDVYITVNSGVYLWASTISNAGLTINSTTTATGDTMKLINNGYIIGKGGGGANNQNQLDAENGGPAIQISSLNGISTITIDNTNSSAYIGGGGGGGGGWFGDASYYCWCWGNTVTDQSWAGGGGGAGGGLGGDRGFYVLNFSTTANINAVGGAGGGITTVGSNGGTASYSPVTFYGGGGGGRILPGTGGTKGAGGGAGGGGSYGYNSNDGYFDPSGSGGAGSATGGTGSSAGAGGGGGWGAAGGAKVSPDPYFGYYLVYPPGAGGKAINLNGKSVAWVSGNTTRVYGGVS
jgi:hypothetical protein